MTKRSAPTENCGELPCRCSAKYPLANRIVTDPKASRSTSDAGPLHVSVVPNSARRSDISRRPDAVSTSELQNVE